MVSDDVRDPNDTIEDYSWIIRAVFVRFVVNDDCLPSSDANEIMQAGSKALGKKEASIFENQSRDPEKNARIGNWKIPNRR